MTEKKPGLLKRIFSFGFGAKKQAPDDLEAQASEEKIHHQQEADLHHSLPETEGAPADEAKDEAPAAAKADKGADKQAVKPADSGKAEPAPKKAKPPAKKGKAEPKAKDKGESAPKAMPKSEAREQAPPAAKPEAKAKAPARRKPAKAEKAKPGEPPSPDLDAQVSAAAGLPEPEPTPKPVPERPAGGKVRLFEERQKPAPQVETDEEARRQGWFARMRRGLSRSADSLTSNIASVFTKARLDDDTLQELEDVLIQADLGVETAAAVTDALAGQRYGKEVTDAEVREIMATEIEKVLAPVALPLELDLEHRPHVILVVGVNGSGKTTTIGKLSAKLRSAGLSTLLVAGDTFRAAAIEQLKIWGERTGAPVVARELGADAAGLAFDAFDRARDEGHDVLLMDTAGRLQNKAELMAELEKIIRVLKKQDESAPHTVLLTLDATTGQNALNQVEIFGQKAGVNGLVMTKLDGTARGGILVSISAKHKLPVYFIGVGETVDDLEPFEADVFARSIAGLENATAGQGAAIDG